ncbi:MAG TPA: hypothetical protein VN820_06345, partial [Acidimicrobiales bacterium]|nr:hypothetical protein [Acidimicrobiales bacterium]
MTALSASKVRKFIRQWRRRYPLPYAWVGNAANRQCRKSEEKWLAQFDGTAQLRRRQIVALIDWRFAHDASRREKALRGVTGPRESGHAKRCIKKALAASGENAALRFLVENEGGIPGWGAAMSSAVLAACRPEVYLVADHRALRSLDALGLYTPRHTDEFTSVDWWPYLRICRRLAHSCGVSLREVGQALRAAADDAPKLPKD